MMGAVVRAGGGAPPFSDRRLGHLLAREGITPSRQRLLRIYREGNLRVPLDPRASAKITWETRENGPPTSGANPTCSLQRPIPRPRPKSMPWLNANSAPSLRPVSMVMPNSAFRMARIDSIWGSRSRLLAIAAISL